MTRPLLRRKPGRDNSVVIDGLSLGAPAPPLAVRGLEEVRSPADLADGGAGLLLFVSEECPTSALAMRRLGPLCSSWKEQGLGAAAVFEDPLAVALRVARRCGWGGTVLAEEPPFETSREFHLGSVPTVVLVDTRGHVAGWVTGWDHPGLLELLGEASRRVGTQLRLPEDLPPSKKPGCASKATLDPALAAVTGSDEMEEMFARGWTDGLPVVPPTLDRVEAMLGSLEGSRSLGPVPPSLGEATLERVAACAVLAGCLPSYFPVVVAAVEAALDPAFNLHGQAVTTQPAGQLVIVNGPVREALGLNSGMGVLGPGERANLTIGRALRLVVSLTGGATAGGLDRATLGHSGKIGLLVAENEEVSPWEPLHVERGFAKEQSVVTLVGSDAPLSISDHRSRTPEDLAYVLGWAAASTWSTNWWPLHEPSVFVICPEHAALFEKAGWSKGRLRSFIFESVRKPAGELRRGETTPFVNSAADDTLVTKWAGEDALVFVVAGGEAGRYSAVLGPCTGMGSQIVSREVGVYA